MTATVAAEILEPITVEAEGVTVASIVWQRFNRPMPGLVEAVLAANPGLSARGVFIPVGTVVVLPIPPQKQQEQVARPVRLWD